MSAPPTVAEPPQACAQVPPSWRVSQPGTLWLRGWRIGEWLDGPLSPLFASWLLPLLVETRERDGSGRFGLELPSTWRVRRPAWTVVEGYFFARAEPQRWSTLTLPPRFILSLLGGDWIERWEDQARPRFLAGLAALEANDLAGVPGSQVLAELDGLAADAAELWSALAVASGSLVPLRQFLTRVGGAVLADAGGVLPLLSGLPSPAIDEQQSLYELARLAAAAPSVGGRLEAEPLERLLDATVAEREVTGFLARLRVHLERFGHLVKSLDLAAPTLEEEPARLGIGLRSYSEPAATEPRSEFAAAVARREQTMARVRAGLPALPRVLFDRLLARAHSCTESRERMISDLQRAWPPMRRRLLELGRRLVAAERLERPDDVFFLVRDELWRAAVGEQMGDLATNADRRRRAWRRQAEHHPPPSLPPPGDPAWSRAMTFPVDLRAAGRADRAGRRVVVGTGASGGRATGRARILGYPAEAPRLARGDVLVTVATTPDWTPLFGRAAAVVTDFGGMSSHSSTVAREYGLPAVVGTREATRVLTDGEWVTVDGDAGEVICGRPVEVSDGATP